MCKYLVKVDKVHCSESSALEHKFSVIPCQVQYSERNTGHICHYFVAPTYMYAYSHSYTYEQLIGAIITTYS